MCQEPKYYRVIRRLMEVRLVGERVANLRHFEAKY